MALNFGWAWCFGADAQEDPKNRSPESLALNEGQRYFYNACLPWLMLYVGIPVVTEETIPIIVARMKLKDSLGHWLINEKCWAKKTPEEFLQAFIGFQTNVGWKSDAEFFGILRRELKDLGRTCPKPLQTKADKDIRELRKSHAQHVAKKHA